MATSPTATQIPINYFPASTRRFPNEKAAGCKIFHRISFFFPSTAISYRLKPIRASKSELDDPSTPFTVKRDDAIYVVKLGAGSLVGAAAIKYGSALFPQITTPDIVQALIMIIGPVILAILLLIKKSSVE